MGAVEHIGQPAPPAALMAVLNRFNRDELGNAIEVLVSLLDIWDGDPDLENATDAEDDHALSPQAIGYSAGIPGCLVSDAADPAWIEWHTMRGPQKNGPNVAQDYEDDEEDDHSGQCSEDEISCGPGNWGGLHHLIGPGCPISDPGDQDEDGI